VSRKKPSSPETHEQPPSLQLVLAAVERAARHRARDSADVPGWAVLEHLDIPVRSGLARGVRPQLGALQEVGSLRRSRRHGMTMWELTAAGRRRLREARVAREVPPLPESPQHRAWRSARTAAAQEVERFGRRLADALAEAGCLLDADTPPHSDQWFALGQRLGRAAWRVASANHCLREWPEPQDDQADVEEYREPGDERLDPAEQQRLRGLRRGRRNIRLWEDGA
jgi:hypothetical protein